MPSLGFCATILFPCPACSQDGEWKSKLAPRGRLTMRVRPAVHAKPSKWLQKLSEFQGTYALTQHWEFINGVIAIQRAKRSLTFFQSWFEHLVAKFIDVGGLSVTLEPYMSQTNVALIAATVSTNSRREKTAGLLIRHLSSQSFK